MIVLLWRYSQLIQWLDNSLANSWNLSLKVKTVENYNKNNVSLGNFSFKQIENVRYLAIVNDHNKGHNKEHMVML